MDFEPLKKINVHNKGKFVFLLLTIIMCLGISFSAASYAINHQDDRDNSINSGLINLDFQEGTTENITLNKAVPVIDDIGMKNKPYTFTIQNTSTVPINAKIELVINQEETSIPLNAVKYAFYIDNSLIKSNTLDTLDGNLIHEITGMEPQAEPINIKIIFWIVYNYESAGGEKFSAKIGATGESFDLIPE